MRRHVAVLVAVMLAATGITTLAAPAQAGYADGSSRLVANNYNITPYTMTLVDHWSQYGWEVPPATLPPGGNFVYRMGGSQAIGGGAFCPNDFRNAYDGYMTYRVEVLGGPAEYLTLAIHGTRSYSDTGCLGYFDKGDVYPALDVWNTTAPPPAGWNPASGGPPPVPATAKPQLTYQHNVPTLFDQTFGIAGDWTADASTPGGSALNEVIEAVCGADPDKCDFTQTGPFEWGIGAPTVAGGSKVNCNQPGGTTQYEEVSYTMAQTASLSVGAGLEVSTEVNLFNIVASKLSISVEAEHEWEDTSTYSRKARMYVPPRHVGVMWTAPVIGTVTGTMKLHAGTATFTLKNFRQQRSGVAKDNLTPAYAAIAQVRPALPEETAPVCPLGRTPAAGADPARVTRLVPGHGVGRLRLGRPAQVSALGAPRIKAPRSNRSPVSNDCVVVDPQCALVTGRGTWAYDDASVVLGPDRRVSAVIYRGTARTAEGVGVGSGLRAVRAAYPDASCVAYARATNCVLTGKHRADRVRTVFHLTGKKGRAVLEQVMIYRVDTQRPGWGA